MTAPARAYSRYVLAVMTAVYTLNLVDRGLMMLLLQPIKEDLRLTDTQLGLVTGIVFGFFYAVLGLPIARWADRGNRASITSMAIGLWGLTVMACLLVSNYTHLVFARMAAAVGESGCKPPTFSLVGDYFKEPAERTRAMAIYWLGNPLATIVSFLVGAWLNELYGWRMTFFLMGIPGLILAVIVKATVSEPRSRDQGQLQNDMQPSFRDALATMWRQRSCRYLSLGLIVVYTISFGLGPWYAAFMMRSHGMSTSELGISLGVIFSMGGIVSLLLGGYVMSGMLAKNEPGQVRVSALTVAGLVPCFVAFLLLPGRYEALAALIPLAMAFNFFIGPIYALMQRLVPDRMRATLLAVIMLLSNLIGMGIGPQVVGILSDALHPAFGRESLRYAMLTMSFLGFLAGYWLWKAARFIAEDLAHGSASAARSV